jgi:hypothetical protein
MTLRHHVPAGRLTRQYFRRWWFWKGISRSRLHRIHPRSDGGQDLSTAKRVAGVPLFALKAMARHIVDGLRRLVRRDIIGATRHEMMLAYYAGFAWEDRRSARSSRPTSSPSRLRRRIEGDSDDCGEVIPPSRYGGAGAGAPGDVPTSAGRLDATQLQSGPE